MRKKPTSRTCGKCKKVFPVGQGHDARTCGKPKKGLPPVIQIFENPTPSVAAKENEKGDTHKTVPTVKGELKGVPKDLFTGVRVYADWRIEVTYSHQPKWHKSKKPIWERMKPEWYKEYDYIEGKKIRIWFNHKGEIHRFNGPAVEHANGQRHWYEYGKLHRTDGPAVEHLNGTKEWWVRGKRHRLKAPAVEYPNGDKEWWVNNQRHRIDGPAVQRWHETEWFIHGKDMRYWADNPSVPKAMGKNFYLLCLNDDPKIRARALLNPNCPPQYKIAAKLAEK